MIKPIMKSTLILSRPARKASFEDCSVADDLLDTLRAHDDECVGMAANMIGKPIAIIVFNDQGSYREMFNPEIVEKRGIFETEEGCLSLLGVRPTKRYKAITVNYQNREMKDCKESFSGWTAQIIQHEIDHCKGILI